MLRLPVFTPFFPDTIDRAVALKVRYGAEAAYVAGGTDLYPNMKRRQQTPSVVLDLRRVGLGGRGGRGADGNLALGAGMTLTQLIRDPLVRAEWPVLSLAAATISTPILQNMGTLGGNLLLDTRCNYYDQGYEWRKAIHFCLKKDGDTCWVAPSSPRCWAVQSSDLAPVMVALGASVTLVGPGGSRTIPATALYLNDGIEYLSKHPDELLTTVTVPALDGARAVYRKVRRRGAFDFPVLGVAAVVRTDSAGVVREARVVVGGVGAAPLLSPEASIALVGQPLSDEAIEAAAAAAARPSKPLDNTDFTIGWRKDLVPITVRRALEDLRPPARS